MHKLAPGDTAPALNLPDQSGSLHTWKLYAGQRVILYVYPAAMTPGCTKQACDFRDSLDALKAAGVTVLGVSPDPVAKLVKFTQRDALTFPLLSDPDRAFLVDLGAFGEKQPYGKTVTGVIRSTFVINVSSSGKAVVEHAFYNVKATGHVAKLRKDLGL